MFIVRCLVWFLRFTLFILLLGFAIKNDSVVDVHFFLHTIWQVPLILVMLTFFALGILLGISVAIIPLLKQLREIHTLRRTDDSHTPQAPVTHPRRKQDQGELYS